jgi:hemolysin III
MNVVLRRLLSRRMNWIKASKKQTINEETWNVITHLAGVAIGIIGLVLMVLKAKNNPNPVALISSVIFGLSFIILYASSTLYHLQKDPDKKKKLRVFDHASIFLLIAGSYTPITLLVMNNTKGWIYFGIEWGIALVGITLKIFYTGKWEKLSLVLYLIMGWLIVFDLPELLEKIQPEGFQFIIYGGLAYTLGAVFYAFNKVCYSHVIWHFFVLAGSLFHFWFVYEYAL